METIRVAFSLSPDKDLWREIVNASDEISEDFRNMNEIDDDTYPPHLSAHICTIDADALDTLKADLAALWSESATLGLNVAKVAAGTSGYVSVEIERTDELMAMHRSLIECAAKARTSMRPNADASGESNEDRYGNAYVLDQFQPHFSVAKVDFQNQSDAVEIAQEKIKSNSTKVAALQLVDISADNSTWDVIWSS